MGRAGRRVPIPVPALGSRETRAGSAEPVELGPEAVESKRFRPPSRKGTPQVAPAGRAGRPDAVQRSRGPHPAVRSFPWAQPRQGRLGAVEQDGSEGPFVPPSTTFSDADDTTAGERARRSFQTQVHVRAPRVDPQPRLRAARGHQRRRNWHAPAGRLALMNGLLGRLKSLRAHSKAPPTSREVRGAWLACGLGSHRRGFTGDS